jgi:hypothetical protein
VPHCALSSEIRLCTRKEKGCRQQIGDACLVEGAVLFGKEDNGIRGAEFEDGLAAGPAGLAGCVVEVGDGDGPYANGRAMDGDGGDDCGLLGASGEAVGAVFDVAASDRGPIIEKNGGSDTEVAVGSIGVLGGRGGLPLKFFDYGFWEIGGRIRRHDCEANGWVSR